MFRWVPWWFDFQYRLFMSFAPTRWLALRLLTGLGRRGLMRLIRVAQPGRDRVHVPGRDRGTGRAAANRALEGAGLLVDHRSRGHAVLGASRASTCISSPIRRRSRRSRASPARAASAGPSRRPRRRSWRRARAPTRGARWGCLGTGPRSSPCLAADGASAICSARPGPALQVPDAIVLCLCGRNDKLRARVSRELGGEPRLRVMGFTDRMGDVLAASDALVHSSAGLTVLEAIIRGCPVISYGFGYGHVRVSNEALVRFGLAQVAPKVSDIGPALDRALEHRPEPNGSFARRPSTASLILSDERRSVPLPAWRVRTARWALTGAAAVAIAELDAHHGRVLQPRLALRAYAPGDRRGDDPARGRRADRRAGERDPDDRELPGRARHPRLVHDGAGRPIRRSRSSSPTAIRRCRACPTAASCAGSGPVTSYMT